MTNKTHEFDDWLNRLWTEMKLQNFQEFYGSREDWWVYYDDGYTPLEALTEDLSNA